MFQDTHSLRLGAAGHASPLTAAAIATRRFVEWWGSHQAWPANEPARIAPRR